jgi:hypothetical protein
MVISRCAGWPQLAVSGRSGDETPVYRVNSDFRPIPDIQRSFTGLAISYSVLSGRI